MYKGVKRVLDVVISLVGLFLLSPVLLVILLLIRLESPGSPLFSQERVGFRAKLFTIYKLRTMRTDAPSSVATDALHGSYITPLGRVLRKTSMDELPQLFNVLMGDMSLIGPRPLVPSELEIHEARAKVHAYDVRPGITGLAQVNGRDCVDPEAKADFDGFYAAHISLWLDLKILFLSVMAVATARGVREGATVFDAQVDDPVKKDVEPPVAS